MSEPTISTLLKLLNPNLLIYDLFQPWAPTLASAHNIPAILFYTTGAASFCFGHYHLKNPGVEFQFPSIHLEEQYRGNNINRVQQSPADENDNMGDWFLKCTQKSSNIILIKTCREIEAKFIDYLSVLTEKKIVPVGVLVQDPIDENNHECFLTHEEMEEIAHGLELSSINFIWAVKFPMGEKIRIDEVLPQGFLDRVGDRGMVVEGWAPQTKILEHSSIGGFMSHCGWSSVVEGIRYGVPIIAMPLHGDQPLNAKFTAEIGIGVEVKREKDGRIERREVAKVIREVIVGKKGEEVRRKAKEMSEKIGKKGQEEIDVVVEELMQLCKKSEG
ncbi:hypothetical protein HHK36_018106 [Tetracentron sinense]|uniref:Uncharacterized protein n=1 Tax=Tetracentron sinense TaxID=13715 RepID=A0A835DA10_TETSI|nr:hypothetical protein HHK36_018106 [Tetracentron sinense]